MYVLLGCLYIYYLELLQSRLKNHVTSYVVHSLVYIIVTNICSYDYYTVSLIYNPDQSRVTDHD